MQAEHAISTKLLPIRPGVLGHFLGHTAIAEWRRAA
jgi:hypothetical protein